MINKYIECYINENFNSESMSDIIKTLLDGGFKGLSINPSCLDILENYVPLPNISVNLDYPFSFYSNDIRSLVLKEIIKKYKNTIKAINFSPIYSFLDNWSINKIFDDFKSINELSNKNKIETRLFLDISYYQTDVIYRISELASQAKIDRVILGCFNKKYFNIQDTLINIDRIKKFSNTKTGIFGNLDLNVLSDYEYFSESNLKQKNDIIFVRPKNILSNFHDSV